MIRRITTCTEFERIELPKSDLLHLGQRKVVELSEGGPYFAVSGVFSGVTSTYIVLPWILENLLKTQDQQNTNQAVKELIRDPKWFFDNLVSASKTEGESTSGQEFVYLAMLLKLEQLVHDGLRFNIFRSEQIRSLNLRGRWLSDKDLSITETPTTFTCETDECDRNHPILSIALQFARELRKAATSPMITRRADKITHWLEPITDSPSDIKITLKGAIRLAHADKRFQNWRPWLKVLEERLIQANSNSLIREALGADFEFDSANFFEDAVQIILNSVEFKTFTQISGKILGGATWNSSHGSMADTDSPPRKRKARQRSRPDIYVARPGQLPLLIECKYKELVDLGVLPNPNKTRVKLGSDDRNQILSFVLSQLPTTSFNTTSIIVIFPIPDESIHSYETESLVYNARMQRVSGSNRMAVEWSDTPVPEAEAIKIHFYGLKVISCLRSLNENADQTDRSKLKSFISRLSSNN